MNIKAVLIDIDNTLLDFNKSAFVAINNTAVAHSVILPENHFEVFLRINDVLWQELECGLITKDDIYKNRWKRIFEELDITCDYAAFEDNFRKEMRKTAITVEGAVDLLSYLSKKYPVYTASNASRLQQKTRLESAELAPYLSGMFTSEEIGFQKPAKEFFYSCCLEIVPVLPEEIVMIGDSVDADIIGAKNFGLKTIWFDYYNKNYSELNFTDYRVTSLTEIKNIL